MDIAKIKSDLSAYGSPAQLSIFGNYLSRLLTETKSKSDNTPKNPWMRYAKNEDLVNVFIKVKEDGLVIDGDSITLQFKGSIKPRYDYHAYKNRLMIAYPETILDVSIVYEGDKYSFSKESGKVTYKHEIADPFSIDREAIGAYCVIKNSRGEFIETLNIPEITKMKNAAKTKNVWDQWYGQMIKKSVLKRACKFHFKDKFKSIEEIDNEDYDLEAVDVSSDLQKRIKNASLSELKKIFEGLSGGPNEPKILEMLAVRKEELKAEKLGA